MVHYIYKKGPAPVSRNVPYNLLCSAPKILERGGRATNRPKRKVHACPPLPLLLARPHIKKELMAKELFMFKMVARALPKGIPPPLTNSCQYMGQAARMRIDLRNKAVAYNSISVRFIEAI